MLSAWMVDTYIFHIFDRRTTKTNMHNCPHSYTETQRVHDYLKQYIMQYCNAFIVFYSLASIVLEWRLENVWMGESGMVKHIMTYRNNGNIHFYCITQNAVAASFDIFSPVCFRPPKMDIYYSAHNQKAVSHISRQIPEMQYAACSWYKRILLTLFINETKVFFYDFSLLPFTVCSNVSNTHCPFD